MKFRRAKKPIKSGCVTISFEGCDRLGKSTQVKLLVEHLKQRGFKALSVKSPYNDFLSYRLVYWMLHNGTARQFPNVFQIVQFLNKMLFQIFVLPILFMKYDFLILDRWSLSMLAYGLADDASQTLTYNMMAFLFEPDYTIILDGRPHLTEGGDSYENDLSYQSKVRLYYNDWIFGQPLQGCCFNRHPWEAEMIDANKPVQDVFYDIKQALYRYSGVMR